MRRTSRFQISRVSKLNKPVTLTLKMKGSPVDLEVFLDLDDCDLLALAVTLSV